MYSLPNHLGNFRSIYWKSLDYNLALKVNKLLQKLGLNFLIGLAKTIFRCVLINWKSWWRDIVSYVFNASPSAHHSNLHSNFLWKRNKSKKYSTQSFMIVLEVMTQISVGLQATHSTNGIWACFSYVKENSTSCEIVAKKRNWKKVASSVRKMNLGNSPVISMAWGSFGISVKRWLAYHSET